MKTGMLWFDDDATRTLSDKIVRAAKRYTEKYKQAPSVVYANPQTLSGASYTVALDWADAPVALKESRSILPNHFWLGIEGD